MHTTNEFHQDKLSFYYCEFSIRSFCQRREPARNECIYILFSLCSRCLFLRWYFLMLTISDYRRATGSVCLPYFTGRIRVETFYGTH
jgi:hypothetical protein